MLGFGSALGIVAVTEVKIGLYPFVAALWGDCFFEGIVVAALGNGAGTFDFSETIGTALAGARAMTVAGTGCDFRFLYHL